jgi:phosphoglycolate phosphatase-like HAD superfamily hydrolase
MGALLFDCDGVLADTERDGHRVSFNKAFGENGFGFEWDVDEYGRLCEIGGGKERMTHYFNLPENSWPAGYESPTTQELSKGLPVRGGGMRVAVSGRVSALIHARSAALG